MRVWRIRSLWNVTWSWPKLCSSLRRCLDNSTHAFQTNLKFHEFHLWPIKNKKIILAHLTKCPTISFHCSSILSARFAVLSGSNRLQLGDRIWPINSGLPRNERKKIRKTTWTIQSSNKSLAIDRLGRSRDSLQRPWNKLYTSFHNRNLWFGSRGHLWSFTPQAEDLWDAISLHSKTLLQ